MSAQRILRRTAILLAAATLASGCVVVVDGEHDRDEEWGVTWNSGSEVDRRVPGGELAQAVSGRLAADPELAGQDITVSSREGVVTLHGRVDSVAALERAMDVASGEPGVVRVVSRLTVVREGG